MTPCISRKAHIDYVPLDKLTSQYIRDAEAAWMKVCELPVETLQAFGYEPDGRQSGVGFEVKTFGTSFDHKYDMHLTLKTIQDQLLQADKVDATGTFFNFILLAQCVLESTKEMIRAYVKSLGDPLLVEETMCLKDRWMLRFLWYPPGLPSGEVLAMTHADKGGFTLDLINGNGRFEYLETREPLVWKEMEKHTHLLPVLAGIGLQELTKCKITAVAHRVVADSISCKEGRVAAVIFVDYLTRKHFNKAVHGSQQLQPLGWNYTCTPEEFATYFVE